MSFLNSSKMYYGNIKMCIKVVGQNIYEHKVCRYGSKENE